MIKSDFKRLLFLYLIFSAFNLFAETSIDFKKLFQTEQYEEAIELLNTPDDGSIPINKKDYLRGLCFSRLRQYDQAIVHFKQAIKSQELSHDLHYELGQALYAINNLKHARREFLLSAAKNFNYTASMYYAAYISELLEEDNLAKSYYRKLIKDGRTDKKFLQISIFQYAKIILKIMRKEELSLKTVERNINSLDIDLAGYVSKNIFPILKKGLSIDPSSQIGADIESFKNDIYEEFKLSPNVLANGRRISPERLYANIALRLKYDNNVALYKKASTIYESETFIKYDFVMKKKFISSPEARLSYTKYKDQKNALVFRNDSLNLSTALRNKFEHIYKEKPASFLLDLEYSEIKKDWKANHKLNHYSKTQTVGIGEQLPFVDSGDTYLKFRFSRYNDKSGYSNYKLMSVTADQYTFLKEGQHLLITTLDMSQLNYYENESISYNTYLARFIYLVFEIFPTYTVQMIFSATLTDPKTQRPKRGLELTINPSIDISKALTNKLKFSVNFNFTENSSKQIEYKYHRSVVGSEISYTF